MNLSRRGFLQSLAAAAVATYLDLPPEKVQQSHLEAMPDTLAGEFWIETTDKRPLTERVPLVLRRSSDRRTFIADPLPAMTTVATGVAGSMCMALREAKGDLRQLSLPIDPGTLNSTCVVAISSLRLSAVDSDGR